VALDRVLKAAVMAIPIQLRSERPINKASRADTRKLSKTPASRTQLSERLTNKEAIKAVNPKFSRHPANKVDTQWRSGKRTNKEDIRVDSPKPKASRAEDNIRLKSEEPINKAKADSNKPNKLQDSIQLKDEALTNKEAIRVDNPKPKASKIPASIRSSDEEPANKAKADNTKPKASRPPANTQ